MVRDGSHRGPKIGTLFESGPQERRTIFFPAGIYTFATDTGGAMSSRAGAGSGYSARWPSSPCCGSARSAAPATSSTSGATRSTARSSSLGLLECDGHQNDPAKQQHAIRLSPDATGTP
jgi:hypothetical protein